MQKIKKFAKPALLVVALCLVLTGFVASAAEAGGEIIVCSGSSELCLIDIGISPGLIEIDLYYFGEYLGSIFY